ncbi:serpin family protein, partial [bacterium]|nr:serpin family protein [bacterium]
TATALRPEAPEFVMNVNRPFLFAVRDTLTGMILFEGAVLGI